MLKEKILWLVLIVFLCGFAYITYTVGQIKSSQDAETKTVKSFEAWQIQATQVLNTILQNAVSRQEFNEAIKKK